jgi:hypothetical protein
MTKYYEERLINAYNLHLMTGWNYKRIAEHYGFGKAATDHIRGMFNRFVKIEADLRDVREYLAGNYLVSFKALEYYIRFVGGGDRQISGERLAEELGIYDVEQLKCMLRGLTATQPDLLYYTDTNGMDCLTIR